MDCVDSDELRNRPCYKLRSEKTLSGDIVAVQWSPKMDLLALALKDGSVSILCIIFPKNSALFILQVILNRLSWQRVWITSPAHSPVTAISWKPDGRGI